MPYLINFIKEQLKRSLVLFLLVGGTSTAVQFIILIIMVEFFGINEIISSSLGYAFSSICNYLLNYFFTFKSNKNHSETIIKFLLVVAFGLTLNAISFWVFNQITSHYIFSQTAALIITTTSNYLLHKHWIYKVKPYHE